MATYMAQRIFQNTVIFAPAEENSRRGSFINAAVDKKIKKMHGYSQKSLDSIRLK
jgi:hypothetical protein